MPRRDGKPNPVLSLFSLKETLDQVRDSGIFATDEGFSFSLQLLDAALESVQLGLLARKDLRWAPWVNPEVIVGEISSDTPLETQHQADVSTNINFVSHRIEPYERRNVAQLIGKFRETLAAISSRERTKEQEFIRSQSPPARKSSEERAYTDGITMTELCDFLAKVQPQSMTEEGLRRARRRAFLRRNRQAGKTSQHPVSDRKSHLGFPPKNRVTPNSSTHERLKGRPSKRSDKHG